MTGSFIVTTRSLNPDKSMVVIYKRHVLILLVVIDVFVILDGKEMDSTVLMPMNVYQGYTRSVLTRVLRTLNINLSVLITLTVSTTVAVTNVLVTKVFLKIHLLLTLIMTSHVSMMTNALSPMTVIPMLIARISLVVTNANAKVVLKVQK